MSWTDLLGIAIHNLRIRKLRTCLNVIGIVISCVLLLATLGAAAGLRAAIDRFLEGSHDALRFVILPTYDKSIVPPEEAVKVDGEMSDRRRQRMQSMLLDQWRRDNLPRPSSISYNLLAEVLEHEHVVDVVPAQQLHCVIGLKGTLQPTVIAVASYVDQDLQSRIIAGVPLESGVSRGVLVHENFAYAAGVTADLELTELIGTEIEIQLQRSVPAFSVFGSDFMQLSSADQEQLLAAIDALVSGSQERESIDARSLSAVDRFAELRRKRLEQGKESANNKRYRLKVVGFYRSPDEDDPINMLNRYARSEGLIVHHSTLSAALTKSNPYGPTSATVFIDHVRNLERVVADLEEKNVRCLSPLKSLQRIYDTIDRSKYSVLVVVLVILVVSAVGISNTMIMSVVERSEEIGILKAIGASSGQVKMMILYEGAVTGLIGGMVAIATTSISTWAANGIVLAYATQRILLELEGSVFLLSWWMMAATMATSVLVATLASYWPASKAARIDPVVAMGRT